MVVDDSKADVIIPTIHPGYNDHEEQEDITDSKADAPADRAMASFQIKRIKLDANASRTESQITPQQEVFSSPSTSSSTTASSSTQKNKRPARQTGKQKVDTVSKHSKPYSLSDSALTSSGDTLADEDHVMVDYESKS